MNRLKKLFLTSVAATSLLTSFAGSVDYEKGVPQAPVQTYTQQAQKNAPILIKGTNAEKEQLWEMYSEISATPTGEELIQKLNETYERTGKKVTIEITDLDDGTYGAYSGGTNKITINKKYLTNLKLMNSINPQAAKSGHEVITLAHELKHFIQINRTRNETNTTYPNLKDLYIAKKILELETCIQDVVLAAERETMLQSDKKETSEGNEALVSLYRDLTKEGMEKYSDDAQKAKRYAKTELAKKLWENENLPLHQRVLSLFTEVQDKIAYDRINHWNFGYDVQANLHLIFSDDCKFSLKKENATILFEEYIKEMGIDLSPNYLRENLTNSLPGYTYSVKDDEIEIEGVISLELKKNKNGGVTFSRLMEGKKTTENIFDENGKCLSAQTFLGPHLIKTGNVNLGLDETHFNAVTDIADITITCEGTTTTYYYKNPKQIHEVRDKDGNVLEYYAPDGKKLPTEEEFKKGKNGIFLGYDQFRNFKKIQYKNGKKEGDELYYRDGTICKKISSEGTTTTYYYENPKQIHEVRNKDGKVIACFSPEGKSLTPEDEFKNGKDGTFLGFDQDGHWRQTTYKNGKKNGPEIQPYQTYIYENDRMIESSPNGKKKGDFPRQEEIKPLGSEKSVPKSSLKRTLTANTISKSGPAITPERQPQQKKVSVKSILPSKSEQR